MAREKIQIIVCAQIYQQRHSEISDILSKWMKEMPGLNVI